MTETVVDASAVLALLNAEPGSAAVAAALAGAATSAVNLSEVAAKLADIGMPAAEARAVLEALGLDVYVFDDQAAWQAAALRRSTRHLGLSFGDRACLALALRLSRPVLTTDRAWQRLTLGVRVQVVR